MVKSMSRKQTFILLISLFLSACNSLPSTPLNVRVDAAENLNPDTSLVSLPVRLKVYQLSDVTLFKEATFRQLWKSDITTLSATLKDKKELTVNPGETLSIKMPRHPQAEFIAVVGVFRQHEDNGWKTIKPLPGNVGTFIKPITITAKGHAVEIAR